ncbi:MAG TPA: hypothetical protein VIE64_00415 [Solirubrobacterales bacterium]|jgi:hypothetical protein
MALTRIARAWRRWRTREERFIVRSRWLRQVTPERRARAERILLAEPKLAVDLLRILNCDEDLGEHFVLGFTAQPDPISSEKRLSDGFAAMALRCEQLRLEALARRRIELERSARRAVLRFAPSR